MFATVAFWGWAASVVLGLAFGAAGLMKLVLPMERIGQRMEGLGTVVPGWLVRLIGICELAGVIGLFLPVLTGIAVFLTPLAALGLALIQVLAIGFHAQRHETARTLPINLVLLALSLFVAWVRWSAF